MASRSQGLHRYLNSALLVMWSASLTVALASWGAWHYVALAGPAASEVARLDDAHDHDGWRMVHVLAADCGCSEGVGRRLASRKPQAGLVEEVWVVGDSPTLTATLRTAGFTVTTKAPEALATGMNIQGMPWLLIARDGDVLYSGGYASRNPATVAQLEDVALWHRLQAGDHPQAFPAFGCATSRSARAAVDPLGLKYPSR
ncbi:MAG TPA: hypothetical protein VMF13_05830 [Luteitalea sp.]|nr:hypothetical protein [Luteitalea sp.]